MKDNLVTKKKSVIEELVKMKGTTTVNQDLFKELESELDNKLV